ncbi:hypothetical protein Sjap_026467 [Stephania japonica]|uniref:Uncharacterized protein n=1 Tax=Stephania japonica TaxID=461633 RepID=A0AAP0HIX2_9MAGN
MGSSSIIVRKLGWEGRLNGADNAYVVDLEHPVLEVRPSPHVGYPSRDGAKDILSSSRVRVAGLSRVNIRNYFNSIRITVTPSGVIPERLHNKIAICFHRAQLSRKVREETISLQFDAALASCQCGKDDWGTLQKGNWSAFMSPYEDKYLDLKFSNGLSKTLTVSIEEKMEVLMSSIAQFVKCAMRSMAMTFIYQVHLYQGNESPWLRRANRGSTIHNRTEFLSRSTEISTRQKMWNSHERSSAWSVSPTKGLVLSSPSNVATVQKDYYSTLHKTPTRKRFSKKEWNEFTRESTREALVELASSPEFTDWIVNNADRLKIDRSNSDDSVESESNSLLRLETTESGVISSSGTDI